MSLARTAEPVHPAAFVLPAGNRIESLIFDLDGTLYLNRRLQRAMAMELLRAGLRHPLTTWQEARIVYHFRRAQEHLRKDALATADQQLPLAAEWSGVAIEQVKYTADAWMDQAPLPRLRPCLRPGIVDLLKAARARDVRLAVLSDYPAHNKLAALDLAAFFPVALSAQDPRIGSFKPSPKGLLVALAQLGVAPEKAVYIGDRPSVDGEAARRTGVAAVILGQPSHSQGPGWIGAPDVASLRALLEI